MTAVVNGKRHAPVIGHVYTAHEGVSSPTNFATYPPGRIVRFAMAPIPSDDAQTIRWWGDSSVVPCWLHNRGAGAAGSGGQQIPTDNDRGHRGGARGLHRGGSGVQGGHRRVLQRGSMRQRRKRPAKPVVRGLVPRRQPVQKWLLRRSEERNAKGLLPGQVLRWDVCRRRRELRHQHLLRWPRLRVVEPYRSDPLRGDMPRSLGLQERLLFGSRKQRGLRLRSDGNVPVAIGRDDACESPVPALARHRGSS